MIQLYNAFFQMHLQKKDEKEKRRLRATQIIFLCKSIPVQALVG